MEMCTKRCEVGETKQKDFHVLTTMSLIIFSMQLTLWCSYIEEKAPHILNKTDDFKLLCEEYD